MQQNNKEKGSIDISESKDFINTQYNRLSEDWRHFSNLIWQLPTVAITICSAIVGVVYSVLKDSPWYSKVALLIFGIVFLSMILIELLKLRLFQNMRTEHLLYIEMKMKKKDDDIQPIQTITTPKGIYFQHKNPIIIENEETKRVLYIDPHETATGTVSSKPKTCWVKFKLWLFRRSAITGQVIAMIIVIIGLLLLVIMEVFNALN